MLQIYSSLIDSQRGEQYSQYLVGHQGFTFEYDIMRDFLDSLRYSSGQVEMLKLKSLIYCQLGALQTLIRSINWVFIG